MVPEERWFGLESRSLSLAAEVLLCVKQLQCGVVRR